MIPFSSCLLIALFLTTAFCLNVTWQGMLNVVQSQALINREICYRLKTLPDIQLNIQTQLQTHFAQPEFETRFENLLSAFGTDSEHVDEGIDVTVRHQWFKDWRDVLPSSGKWVLFHPWEFCALPSDWLIPMRDHADEIWVYSQYNKQCYIRSGINAVKIRVIPLGFDPLVYYPAASATIDIDMSHFPYPPAERQPFGFTGECKGKQYRFLYVGGSLTRKGIEETLTGYRAAFYGVDGWETSVCLVVKDLASKEYYSPLAQVDLIRSVMALKDRPAIEYIDRTMTNADMARLYRSCDVLVSPYRAEGFGLPILEAMASGLPVIVTNGGSAKDFVTEEYGILVQAEEVDAKLHITEMDTVFTPKLFMPNVTDFARLLQYAYTHQPEMKQKGQAAARFAHAHMTWDHTADIVAQALREIASRPAARTGVEVMDDLALVNMNSEATGSTTGVNNTEFWRLVRQYGDLYPGASAVDWHQYLEQSAIAMKYLTEIRASNLSDWRKIALLASQISSRIDDVFPCQNCGPRAAGNLTVLERLETVARVSISPFCRTILLVGIESGGPLLTALLANTASQLYIVDEFVYTSQMVANAIGYTLYPSRVHVRSGNIEHGLLALASANMRFDLVVVSQSVSDNMNHTLQSLSATLVGMK